jgi:hypothetical protein
VETGAGSLAVSGRSSRASTVHGLSRFLHRASARQFPFTATLLAAVHLLSQTRLRLAAAAEEVGPRAPPFRAATQPGHPRNFTQKARGAVDDHWLNCPTARPVAVALPAGLGAEPALPAEAAQYTVCTVLHLLPASVPGIHILLAVPVAGPCEVLGRCTGPHLPAASHRVLTCLLLPLCMPRRQRAQQRRNSMEARPVFMATRRVAAEEVNR